MNKAQAQKLVDAAKAYNKHQSAAPAAGAQTSDDVWDEIAKLHEARETHNAKQVMPRPGHAKH